MPSSRSHRLRLLAVLAVPAALLPGPGCQSRPVAETGPLPPARPSGWRWPSSPEPRVRLSNEDSGRIVQVHERLRFAVVDAGLNPLPAPGTLLQVFRDGQPVGELKAGRTTRGSVISADFVAGQPQAGDQARWTAASPR
ncbi:MAG: hypothetical protein ACKO3N_15860 [Verrucomicrobiota bacterium]